MDLNVMDSHSAGGNGSLIIVCLIIAGATKCNNSSVTNCVVVIRK